MWKEMEIVCNEQGEEDAGIPIQLEETRLLRACEYHQEATFSNIQCKQVHCVRQYGILDKLGQDRHPTTISDPQDVLHKLVCIT